MQPTASPRHAGLDTLRGLAILAVMLYHLQSSLPEVLEPVAHFCWMGVDLFFVLSGYLIGMQLLRAQQGPPGHALWSFYRRRLWRILPAYLSVLGLYFLVPAWREQAGISPPWQFLTFTENLFVDYSRNQAFSHAWSLCIEEHFYLVLPFIVLILMRRATMLRTTFVITGLVAVGIAIRAWVFFHFLQPLGPENAGLAYIEHIYYPTWTRMDGLLAGVTLALVKLHRPAWWQRLAAHGHRTLAAGATLFALSLWLFDKRFTAQTGAAMWSTFIGYPILSIALALTVASSISANGWLSRVRVPGAKLISTLAFSLYLTHKEMAHLATRLLPSLTEERDLRTLVTYLTVCLAGAAILYFTVERPALNLRDRTCARRLRSIAPDPSLDPAL